MEYLSVDMLRVINSFLSNVEDTVSWFSITKGYHELKNKITFDKTEEEEDTSLMYLWYYKNIKWAYYVGNSKELANIPKDVTCIYYDAKLDTPLPIHIRHLILGKYAKLSDLNRMVTSFPPQLQIYYMTIIPSSVKELTFGKYYTNRVYDGDIPCHIQVLRLTKHNSSIYRSTIPHGVRVVYIENEVELTHLPLTVKKIHFGGNIQFPKNFPTIQNSITHLDLGPTCNVNIKANCLPWTVTHLYFGKGFNRVIGPNTIPYVTHLFFHKNYNVYLSKEALPKHLQYLEVTKKHQWFYDKLLKGVEIKYLE